MNFNSQNNPFQSNATTSNPFSNNSTTNNPFPSSSSASNPFTGNSTTNNPFQNSTTLNNPFQNNNTASNPFSTGQIQSNATMNNPFQSNTTTNNPFQGNSFNAGLNQSNNTMMNYNQSNNTLTNYNQPNNTLMNNNINSKHQEIYATLQKLENSYDPKSPDYKFSRVFHNIVNGPIERPPNFPIHLWEKYFIPDSNLMPVILNRDQFEERKIQQNDLNNKLNESKGAVLKKIDALRIKKEMVKNKIEVLVLKFRRSLKAEVYGEPIEGIYKIQADVPERSRLGVGRNKDDVVAYLIDMHEKLDKFEKKVSETIHSVERKKILNK